MSHKQRRVKYYNLLLVPDNEQATRGVKVHVRTVRFLAGLTVFIAVLAVAGAATYWKVADVALRYDGLFQENQLLKESLARVEQVAAELEKIKRIDQKLRTSLSGYVSVTENIGEGAEQGDWEGDLLRTVSRREPSMFSSVPAFLPVDGFVTRGYESDAMVDDGHLGIDIAASEGAPIRAAADGVVVFSGWTVNEGFVVILHHRDNFFTFYKHNLRNLCHELEYVKQGQVIALLGNTGEISSGAHVHFEVWQGTKPLDPLMFLDIKEN